MRRVTKWTLGAVATPCLLIAMQAASASDYGCKVLLCLSNPAGPRAVSECVPPINQLFRDLARGRDFPSCDLASAPDVRGGRSWAQQGVSYYDPCPEGTTALAGGTYAIQRGTATLYTGIGEGDGLRPSSGESFSPMPGKVCVGNRVGDASVSMGSGESLSAVAAEVYERAVTLDAQDSPRTIDVFVDSTLYRRVRW